MEIEETFEKVYDETIKLICENLNVDNISLTFMNDNHECTAILGLNKSKLNYSIYIMQLAGKGNTLIAAMKQLQTNTLEYAENMKSLCRNTNI